ncbi:MAG: bifunctional 4-hydroxy-2-oxoglutarate aldolase/2-dehydro-3-deoxy-phosphogluconate aldolase [Treponema sp.]|jgi:2-dehydro-3-deoxyphosphogluconate aldolase/(4S)-4-hydroxy-2-oxoglutarate aldolase|nr:bifunctional 4-hydroxy-2-oxoglutarate aldolase/2-dehydro-3-deoxy-phosphogluconate aldolase [Treponema sp.]
MDKVLEEIGRIGIVPVIKIDDVEKAVPLARALAAGGICCAEVTFRTAQGEESIRRIAAEVPEVLLGAGTVLTTEQVDRAAAAGAKFIVSPGLNPRVLAHCIGRGIPITPGCSNPSDIEQALEAGLEVVKFFPAEQAGGLEYIKAIAAPYPQLKFMPTGGINAGNIARYIAFEKIHACGGSWMVGADLINAGDFEKITALSREALRSMLGFQVVHLGINAGEAAAAAQGAGAFEDLFGFAPKDGASSVFAGEGIEIMKQPGAPGTHGHIAVAVNSVYRAAAFLERKGVGFNPDSVKTDAKGNMTVIYLRDEILGFAVHLVQRK